MKLRGNGDGLSPLPIRKGKFFNVARPDDAGIVDEHLNPPIAESALARTSIH